MNMKRPLPVAVTAVLLSCFPGGHARAQAPTILGVTPSANARAAARNTSLVVSFSQPLTAGSVAALKVFSSQRGGLRGGSTTASGATLAFAPAAYDFRPGETVQYTVTTAAAGSGGGLAMPRVGRFTTAAGVGTGLFGTGAQVALPGTSFGQPHGVALGDLDGDGDLDLVTANDNQDGTRTSTASICLNNGRGAFTLVQNVTVNGRPFAVVLGDVDGDGDLDLATASAHSVGTVCVRLNNGSGVFSGTQNVATDRYPYNLALGDVDGDGDLDLLTANNLGQGVPGSVSVRLNNGSGTFGGTVNVPVGSGSRSVGLGDVDADGDLDLLTADSEANTVSVRLNSGTGTFGGSQAVAVGRNPYGLALGDVDGDGDLDLATANFNFFTNVSTASVRLNNGSGVFGGTQEVSVSTNQSYSGPSMVTLGDVDGDGDLDLLTADAGRSNTVSVRVNDGTGLYSGTQNQDITPGSSPYDVVLGDVDGDGDLDFVTANFSSGNATVRFNGGSGPLAATPGAPPATPVAYPNPATGRVQLSLPPAATRVELLDALGRPVQTMPAQAGAATLDVTGLAPGLYRWRVPTGPQPASGTLVVE